MPVTAQQTQLARRIDTHVRHVLAQGGGDEALLLSLAASMGTFKQLLDTCTGQTWTPSASATTASTALPGGWSGWPGVSPMAASPCRSNGRASRRARATATLPHMGYFVVFVPCLSIAGGAQKTGYLH